MATFPPKEALAKHLSDGGVRGVVIIQDLMQPAYRPPATALANSQAPVCRPGAKIDQDAFGLEDPVGLFKGMNHALVSHSSKGPREDRDVECAGWILELGGASGVVRDAPSIARRQGLASETQLLRVRVDGLDVARIQRGEPQGQSPWATSDLQYAFVPPIRSLVQRAQFMSRGVYDKRHGPSSLCYESLYNI